MSTQQHRTRVLPSRRPRTAVLATASLGALALVAGLAAPASATVIGTVSPAKTSYDRPALVDFGTEEGTELAVWAGTDTDGHINVATVDDESAAVIGSTWTDSSSSTYQGTGVAAAHAGYAEAVTTDYVAVAWTDLNAVVHVGILDSAHNAIACESTNFGYSYDTPDLTFAREAPGDAVAEDLYLTTVDSGGHMHVTQVVDNPANAGCLGGPGVPNAGTNLFAPGDSTEITSDTTYDGPTLFDVSPQSYPTLLMVWAGTNSAHTMNAAFFSPDVPTLSQKYVESGEATTADLSSATRYTTGETLVTYCGTNNLVYGQAFGDQNSAKPLWNESLGGSCNIYTNAAGYINGGVAPVFDTTNSLFEYLYPNKGNLDLTLGQEAP